MSIRTIIGTTFIALVFVLSCFWVVITGTLVLPLIPEEIAVGIISIRLIYAISIFAVITLLMAIADSLIGGDNK